MRQLGPVQADLVMAASGSGSGCPEGVPVELGLLSILAAFGVAFGVLYMALTVRVATQRRRKRMVEEESGCEVSSVTEFLGCRVGEMWRGSASSGWYPLADLLWHGELADALTAPDTSGWCDSLWKVVVVS